MTSQMHISSILLILTTVILAVYQNSSVRNSSRMLISLRRHLPRPVSPGRSSLIRSPQEVIISIFLPIVPKPKLKNTNSTVVHSLSPKAQCSSTQTLLKNRTEYGRYTPSDTTGTLQQSSSFLTIRHLSALAVFTLLWGW